MYNDVFKNFVEICYSVVFKLFEFSTFFVGALKYPLFAPIGQESFVSHMMSALGIEGNLITDVLNWWYGTILSALLGDMTLLDLVLGSGIIIAITIGIIKFFSK